VNGKRVRKMRTKNLYILRKDIMFFGKMASKRGMGSGGIKLATFMKGSGRGQEIWVRIDERQGWIRVQWGVERWKVTE
jgi:hypothetical protein